jgi:hypothetical protein
MQAMHAWVSTTPDPVLVLVLGCMELAGCSMALYVQYSTVQYMEIQQNDTAL